MIDPVHIHMFTRSFFTNIFFLPFQVVPIMERDDLTSADLQLIVHSVVSEVASHDGFESFEALLSLAAAVAKYPTLDAETAFFLAGSVSEFFPITTYPSQDHAMAA